MDSTTVSTPQTSSVSYARILQQEHFPTKEQAIILDAISGFTIHDYTLAVAKLIEPKDIRYVSRISHSRICLYLSSKEVADKLTDNKTTVNIGTNSLEIRPLISKAKRIIVSNVCPIIPHSHIEDELTKFNIKPVSTITSIRAGINDPGFSHILSFRRQMYIQPEDVSKLPESLKITYDNTTYWIYFSTEKITCFLCKEEGHLARHCKNGESHLQQQRINCQDTENLNAYQKEGDQDRDAMFPMINPSECITTLNKGKELMPPPLRVKRPLSSSGSSILNPINKEVTQPLVHSNQGAQQTLKKIKKTAPPTSMEEVNEKLLPATDYIAKNGDKFPINYQELLQFLTESYYNPNVHEVALKHTKDISALEDMLTSIYPHIANRGLKSRFTKLRKKLHKFRTGDATAETSSEGVSSNEEMEF